MTVTPLPHHPAGLRKRAVASATYDTLRRHLGALTSPLDSEKCHAEWMVNTPLGPLNVYDYGDLHVCRITPPANDSGYPGGCRRNPGHRLNHDRLWMWSVQAEDDDAVAWLEHLGGVRLERCTVWGEVAR
jgi:hypothetical protein